MYLKLTTLTSEGILKILVTPRSTEQPYDVNDCQVNGNTTGNIYDSKNVDVQTLSDHIEKSRGDV